MGRTPLSRSIGKHWAPFRGIVPEALVLATSLLLLSATLSSQAEDRRLWLAQVPPQLEVTNILYAREESWGFGLPGDNETGVALYELPEHIARGIQAQGAAFLPPGLEWEPTPVAAPAAWFGRQGGSRPRLRHYLGQWGFGIPVDPAVEALVDEAIATPGSLYAYPRGGGRMLLVVPSARRVVFLFAG